MHSAERMNPFPTNVIGAVVMLREANKNDLQEILELYLHLHAKEVPEDSEHLRNTWNKIL